MQSGYLPTRFVVPKHEESAVGLFHEGEEARTKWPDFNANFEHVATSYGLGYDMKGALLNRRSRDHALQVIKSIPEDDRMDYDHLVAAFNKAYIPAVCGSWNLNVVLQEQSVPCNRTTICAIVWWQEP